MTIPRTRDGRPIRARWISKTGRTCLLVEARDGRLEGYYDQPITQRLILQPRAEFNFAAQNVRDNGIGEGLSDVELGLRLRYEIRREIAPYIGVSWLRKVGDTADIARSEGDRVSSTSLVLGLRLWF